MLLEGESMLTRKSIRDEVAGGTTVDEHGGGIGTKEAGEFDEDSGVGGELVNLVGLDQPER
jgi:putative effector of murein hydrolase